MNFISYCVIYSIHIVVKLLKMIKYVYKCFVS